MDGTAQRVNPGDGIQIWTHSADAYPLGNRWVFVEHDDGYLIRTAGPSIAAPKRPLYLTANATLVSTDNADALLTMQPRDEGDDNQVWKLGWLGGGSGGEGTFVIQTKNYDDRAIGTRYGWVGDQELVTRNTYGTPSFHYYWRLYASPRPKTT
jgi:hypothetical protein